MKVKIKKIKKGVYMMGVWRGNGGISSLVSSRQGDFWHCIKVFSFKNIWRGLTW